MAVMLTSEVSVVKSHHGISVKCSQYRDTGPTDPSLFLIQLARSVSSRDGSVGPVSRYRYHFTVLILQPPLHSLTHIIEGRGERLLNRNIPKIWRNYKLLSPIFRHLQTLYSTLDYVE